MTLYRSLNVYVFDSLVVQLRLVNQIKRFMKDKLLLPLQGFQSE